MEAAMVDIRNLRATFGSLKPFPFDRAFVQDSEARAASLDGKLFIHRVLGALGLSDVAKTYPPKNEAALRQIHEAIVSSTDIGEEHKLSLVFYMLLDMDVATQKTRAEDFVNTEVMPRKYRLFMHGLWFLDHLLYQDAVLYLTHPSLQPEFADDILLALARNAYDTYEPTLPLAYYHTVAPALQRPESVEMLFLALCRASVPEALRFSRTKPGPMRRQLFARLVLAVLQDAGDDESAARAHQFASLALDADEDAWFMDVVASADGKRTKVARDTLLIRRIATGEGGYTGEKGTWGVLMESFRAGSGGRT